MSFNQSKSDKSETQTQYRKTGRSASSNQQHRGYSPAYHKGSSAAGPAPSLSTSRSFKQGEQSRGNVAAAPVNPSDPGTASGPRGSVPNGGHVRPQFHEASEPTVTNTAPKQTEPSGAQRSSRAVPKAPASQAATVNCDSRGPNTPVKSPGDVAKGFSFQFGSISSLMNGMQIPAWTSSTPPNLDEQKRDLARHESYRPAPSLPTPSVPKQQLPREDQPPVDQCSVTEAHLQPKPKKDVQISPTPPASQVQKPSGPPMPGISMPIPFHQPQVSLQFDGPNQQIQSQGMTANSLQMPMPIPLPIGSSQVQQPVFVSGLQPHPMQPPGITRQGQNMGFTPQMAPQMPQLGNLGTASGPPGPLFCSPRYATTMISVIFQIFDMALMQPTFCEMYANLFFHLAGLPELSVDSEKITVKRLVVNMCQEEFERGQEEANKADEEGEVKQSEEEREEKRIKARRRMLGIIRLIGELYKKKMLTERIMHECIETLLGQEDIEALCILMSTIGEMIDHLKAKEHMDAYFERMKSLSNNMKLSSRVRFMLKDTIDLRKNKWQQRRKVEGPKKIEEVHKDAAQERQAQASRLSRGLSMKQSARRGAPMEFSPRGSTMLSPSNAQMGDFREMPSPARGFGSQDARADVHVDERHSYEARTLSVSLTHRPMGDDSITLDPQENLGRGMSVRGPLSMSAAPLPEISLNPGDARRMTAGLNGFSSISEQGPYNQDLTLRYAPDRFGGPAADQSRAPERNLSFGSRDSRTSDRSFNRSLTTPIRAQVAVQNIHSENFLTDRSLGAIKEFYSARDEKEVALCIKDLNSPSFHPTMISLWVTDSFERKEGERDLFVKLLVNLAKSQDGTFSQSQLIKGFQTVISTLEDAVNVAPRAPEFLALIFAKVIMENVLSLNQIGQLIHEGGEELGGLLEAGLQANILGNILEIIKSEKGECSQ